MQTCHINFSCSFFVAIYHLKYCALVYDCYSKVGLPCFKIFCLYKVMMMMICVMADVLFYAASDYLHIFFT